MSQWTANKFLAVAESLRGKAQQKRNCGTASHRPTHRRARILAGMYDDARRLDRLADYAEALAAAHAANAIPRTLAKIPPTAAALERVHHGWAHDPKWDQLGIPPDQAETAARILGELADKVRRGALNAPTDPDVEERKLALANIEGYWPTPPDLARYVATLSDVPDSLNHHVLEPSAGTGALALAVRERAPNAGIYCIERNPQAAAIIKARDFVCETADFLEWEPPAARYDTIVMNPPFELDQDMKHVLRAYSCLKAGGRLVAIMGEGAFFRDRGLAPHFREFLAEVGAWSERLPDDAFARPGCLRWTNVRTRVVVIDRR